MYNGLKSQVWVTTRALEAMPYPMRRPVGPLPIGTSGPAKMQGVIEASQTDSIRA